MKEEILTDALLREFLLGKVNEEQRERIENLFLTDSQAHEKILAAEQDLVEDYLEDSLAAADKELFLARYGHTSAQQRQLQIHKSIKDWALRESAATQTAPARSSALTRFFERFQTNPTLVIPVVVTAMILIVVALVWWTSRREQQAIHQELAQLNTPASLREVPANMSRLDLSPIGARGVDQENEFKKTASIQIVELRLPWIQPERYSSYRVEIVRVGDGDESFTIPPVQAENDRIRIRLPAHRLRRGHYRIDVSGLNPDGSKGSTEGYSLAVSE
jgi:hypothetical protein